MEFDRVIYVPSNASERTTFIDIVTRAIIMAAKGIDVKQELRYEDSRIDFVAVTRARTDLSTEKHLRIVVDSGTFRHSS